MNETLTLNDIVLHDIGQWQRTGYPWEAWARLRREAPVYWYDRPGIDPAWMVTRHADVRAVEADAITFINGGPQLRYANQGYNHRATLARERKAELHGWDARAADDMIYLDAAEHVRAEAVFVVRDLAAVVRVHHQPAAEREPVVVVRPHQHRLPRVHGSAVVRERLEERLLDLAGPLVLQRRRTHDERLFDSGGLPEEQRGDDRLKGLAQPHVVGQKRAPAPGQKQGAAHLVGVKLEA